MKTKVLSLVTLLMLGAFTVFAASKTEKFEVKGGNCEECTEHIQKNALAVDGVTSAVWDAKSQKITVTFDDAKTSVDKIEEAIAKGGNDTANHKATDEAYNKLPDCCKYKRGQ
jgi:copper chaperone CopZ